MKQTQQVHPKVFISYSWSSPEHKKRVMDLATRLRESGIDAVLDVWDLNKGADAFHFMERMVNDPDISKVVIICDKSYVAKANGRLGGVGAETRIISPKIYEGNNQNKFVAVVFEKDENGNPYRPTCCESHIYIDMSNLDHEAENFEELLRWIYDKPSHEKPEIGERPSFLSDEGISLGTTALYGRVFSEIQRGNDSSATGTLRDYLDTFARNLEKFRIIRDKRKFDEQLIENLDKFLPYSKEIVSVFDEVACYNLHEENITVLHRFFEKLIPYMDGSHFDTHSGQEYNFDNFKFMVNEMFLWLIAILLKHEKFSEIDTLLSQKYLNRETGQNQNFNIFHNFLKSLEVREKRLGSCTYIHVDLLKERSEHLKTINFENIMQADLVLYMRGYSRTEHCWRPKTLMDRQCDVPPFEIFARAGSKQYFDKVKCVLGIDSIEDLEAILKSQPELTHLNGCPRSTRALLNFEKLTTEP